MVGIVGYDHNLGGLPNKVDSPSPENISFFAAAT